MRRPGVQGPPGCWWVKQEEGGGQLGGRTWPDGVIREINERRSAGGNEETTELRWREGGGEQGRGGGGVWGAVTRGCC